RSSGRDEGKWPEGPMGVDRWLWTALVPLRHLRPHEAAQVVDGPALAGLRIVVGPVLPTDGRAPVNLPHDLEYGAGKFAVRDLPVGQHRRADGVVAARVERLPRLEQPSFDEVPEWHARLPARIGEGESGFLKRLGLHRGDPRLRNAHVIRIALDADPVPVQPLRNRAGRP